MDWDEDGSGEALMARRLNTVCLSEREIEDFLFCRLSGTTRESIEEHLLVCEDCLNRVEEEEEFKESVRLASRRWEDRELDRQFPAKAKRPQRKTSEGTRRSWLGIGSALVFATLLLLVFQLPELRVWQSEQQIALRLERGGLEALNVRGQAGRSLRLSIDLSDVPAAAAYRVEIVDTGNVTRAAAGFQPAGGAIDWRIAGGLNPGHYWVRLYSAGPEPALLREFSLKLD